MAAAASESTTSTLINTGNLKFCQYCHNIMNALSEKNGLIWNCSIECQQSVENPNNTIEQKLVILSRTDDDDMNIHLNPHNQYTIYDPTLLRCRRECKNKQYHPKDSKGDYPDGTSEMIIFKQNIATANSYYICTVCQATNEL